MPEDQKLKANPSRILWWTRESIAFGLWLFIFIKILIYDVDLILVQRMPASAQVFLKYKFFIFLGVVAILWLVLGNRRFARSVAYVLFYPLVVLLWKIPKLIFKNWVLVLVFSPAIHSLLTSFRVTFILSCAAVIAGLLIMRCHSPHFLIPAMIFLAFYLGRHGAKKIKMAFQPSSVFANIAEIIRKLWESYQKTTIPNQIAAESKLDPTSEAYTEKTLEHLHILYTVNAILQGVLLKLKQSGVSRKLDIYFISSLLYAAFLTVVIFAFEYFGLEKLRPGSFAGPSPIGFWDFLGLSFSTMMTAGLSPLAPKSTWAQILAHGELVVALLLLVILVFVILTIFREKFREDAEQATAELQKGAELIEGHISTHYQLTLTDTEKKLLAKHGAVVNSLRRFRGLDAIDIQAKATSQSTVPPPKTSA